MRPILVFVEAKNTFFTDRLQKESYGDEEVSVVNKFTKNILNKV